MSHDIVPEGFDLDDARNARTTTPDEKKKRCPDCYSTSYRRVLQKGHGSKAADHPHLFCCRLCGNQFDEPAIEVKD